MPNNSDMLEERIEELSLLLIYLTRWSEGKIALQRSWKGYPFETLNALTAKGLAWNSGKAKSICLTPEGIARAAKLETKYLSLPLTDATAPAGIEISFTIPRKIKFKSVYQFRVELADTNPPVWRRFAVPETYTFYDLHVAIQNAMGWEDRHLHAFDIPGKTLVRIECPFAEPEAGEKDEYYTTEVPLSKFLAKEGQSCKYQYDVGDGWQHTVMLEKILPKEPAVKYPLCLDGALACPPEDCGGIGGYQRCIDLAGLKKREPEDEFSVWLWDWQPGAFDPAQVKFENPRKRFLECMED